MNRCQTASSRRTRWDVNKMKAAVKPDSADSLEYHDNWPMGVA